MKVWSPDTAYLQVHRAASGWIIRRAAKSERSWPEDVAGLSDDQALLEFFAEQLSLPAPAEALGQLELQVDTSAAMAAIEKVAARCMEVGGMLRDTLPGPSVPPDPPGREAPAAAIVPPPVSAEVAEALAPLVRLARAGTVAPDIEEILNERGTVYEHVPLMALDVGFNFGQLRALLRAAGLFTDDMRPSQPPAADASVKPAEVAATPLPADAEEPDHDGADATSDGDPLRGQRMDSADVGEGDEL